MAWIRKRRRKTGVFYSVVTTSKKSIRAPSREIAKKILERYEELEASARTGFKVSARCVWTVKDLRVRDLERNPEATRARRWRIIERWFGSKTNLDRISPDRLELFARDRLKTAKPSTVNRDRSVLAAALAHARKVVGESGYALDPFAQIHPLEERKTRRRSVAIEPKTAEKLARRAWELWPTGAIILEILLLTGARVSQVLGLREHQLRDGLLIFPEHKEGRGSAHQVIGRLAEILSVVRPAADGRLFPGVTANGSGSNFRRFWRRLHCECKATAFKRCECGTPALRIHDLRHSATTEALESGWSVADAQRALGHASPRMVENVYSHLRPKAVPPVPWATLGPPIATESPRIALLRGGKTRRNPTVPRQVGGRPASS